jgi:hypothetical protein
MGRKNSKVGRSNDRGRRARMAAKERGISSDMSQARIEVSKMVTPDGRCYLQSRRGKDIFLTVEKAERALKQAQTMRRRSGTGHMEKRFYPCPDGGCGGYHLTSRETYEERGRS